MITKQPEITNPVISHNTLPYKATLAGINDALICIDEQFRIVSLNAAAEKLYNITAAEAIGKKTSELEQRGYIKTSSEDIVASFESRLLFEEFMHNSPLLAWVTDAEGYIHYMNPPYLAAFKNADSLIGKSIFDIYPKKLADEHFANNKKVIETNQPVVAIEKNRLPSGDATFKIIMFPIQYKGKNMIAGWGVNISEQIEAQENLMQLNHHKDKLVSVMAHDVRGPLGVNAKFIEDIVKDFDELDRETTLNYLGMLKTGITRCFDLVDELLTWVKVQLSKASFNPHAFNIQTEILKVIDNLHELISQKNLKVKIHLLYTDKVYADHDLFMITLRNILSNAIKFSYLNGTIEIGNYVHDGMIKVSIEDHGTGMKQELVKRILSKQNFESQYGTKGEKGTGLGLNLAKDYIEQNGGELSIKSEYGMGSTFYFTLPLAIVPLKVMQPVA